MKIDQEQMSFGKVLLSILLGLAAGAVLGTLLTPGKGSKRKIKVSESGNAGSDTVNSINGGIYKKLIEVLNTVTGKLKTLEGRRS